MNEKDEVFAIELMTMAEGDAVVELQQFVLDMCDRLPTVSRGTASRECMPEGLKDLIKGAALCGMAVGFLDDVDDGVLAPENFSKVIQELLERSMRNGIEIAQDIIEDANG